MEKTKHWKVSYPSRSKIFPESFVLNIINIIKRNVNIKKTVGNGRFVGIRFLGPLKYGYPTNGYLLFIVETSRRSEYYEFSFKTDI